MTTLATVNPAREALACEPSPLKEEVRASLPAETSCGAVSPSAEVPNILHQNRFTAVIARQ